MVETLRFSKIGAEDLALGSGTFEVELSDGRRVALTEINLATFSSGAPADTVYYSDASGALTQDTDFTYDDTVSHFNVAGNITAGTAAISTTLGQLYAVADGAVSIALNNSAATVGDALIVWYKAGSAVWNVGYDDSNSDYLQISDTATPNTVPHMLFSNSGTGQQVTINDSTVNASNDFGLTINNQGSADTEILTLKSTQVAHGITTFAETDTCGYLGEATFTEGGLKIEGLAEQEHGIIMRGIATTEVTGTATGSTGCVAIDGVIKSGTSITALGATGNILAIRSAAVTRAIFKNNGDLELDGTANDAAFDDHNDIQLLQAVKAIGNVRYRETLGDWVENHLDILENGGVISRYDGGFFISTQGMQGLMIDAFRQLNGRIEALEAGA